MNNPIQIETRITAPIQKVWDAFIQPEAIMEWNAASPDWHCPEAVNDLRPDGRFRYLMAAKDGSMQFDFAGTYTTIEPLHTIAYTLDDGRKVHIAFSENEGAILVTEAFEAETINSRTLQQDGWQAILDRFKQYVDTH